MKWSLWANIVQPPINIDIDFVSFTATTEHANLEETNE
jgi:hypothetical protein